jgi:aryl-alcohol dehydrogenase-like predicted oxidoreductase
METRKLGYTDLEFTTVGLGTWAIGGPWEYGWGPQDDENSIKTIHEALDAGINWIDTAPIYGCGHSEEVVGAALKHVSYKPLIATKCGLRWNERREKINNLRAESIIKECEESLERLGVEVIDLYQMHWAEPDGMIEEAFGAMAKCVEQGKVRYIGVSNYTVDQLKRIGEVHPVASLQPNYSMLKRGVEGELLGYCKANGIGVVCYSPMQKGLLTGKFDKQKVAGLDEGDVRRRDPDFAGERFEKNMDFVDKLKAIAERNGRSVAQLAISWVLRRDEVTAAICGARRPGQISETAEAGDWRLSDGDIAEIDELLKSYYG